MVTLDENWLDYNYVTMEVPAGCRDRLKWALQLERSTGNAAREAEGSLEGVCRTWLEEHRVKGLSSPGSSRYKYID